MRRLPTSAIAFAILAAACARGTPPAATQPAADEHAGPAMPAAAHAEHREGEAEEMQHNRHFLVGTDSLAARLGRAGTVVIHVGRSDSAYLAGHIPGARFLAMSAVAREVNGLANEFPPLEEMRRVFEGLQIGDSSRVVIYGDDPGLLAARAWIALDLLGQADRTALLDGGLVRWRAENRPVETGPVMHTMQFVPFTARPRPEVIVTADWVRARLRDSTVLLVDARPANQFASDHIPGARSLYWMNGMVSRENPVLKPMHELHHMVWQAAGTDRPGLRTIVTYCQSGPQAGHAYFQARYIGYPDVRLYDGSFADWIARGNPVER